MDLPLLLAITVFFWLVTQAWTLLVFWAEERATRPSAPAASEFLCTPMPLCRRARVRDTPDNADGSPPPQAGRSAKQKPTP
ncbi:hypothetical protein ASC92_27420 [Variovorax sp. Root411]|nr:hypothetical protein ASC92_27420 [Variovorax sp. Root411]